MSISKVFLLLSLSLISSGIFVGDLWSAEPKLKILVAGGHPDDPEASCGGTIAKYTGQGHAVSIMYLTTGEAGIDGVGPDEAAKIRKAEALQACEILNAKPIFVGQIDGATEINSARYDRVRKIVIEEAPDVIFTHWPVDTHRDHRVCTNLIYDAWLATGRQATLYYYESISGGQTQTFLPSDSVDISDVLQQKHRACFAHVSQHVEQDYPSHHLKMELFRGMQNGADSAEAFMRQFPGPATPLP